MNINTGIIKIAVNRDGEPVGEISFNPNSLEFIENCYALFAEIDEKKKQYDSEMAKLKTESENDEYGIPKNIDKRLALNRETCMYLRSRIDSIFGEGTSNIVFGNYNSVDMFESFFNEIAPHIEKARKGKVDRYINKGTNLAQRRAVIK